MNRLVFSKPDCHQPTLEAAIQAWVGIVGFDAALVYSPSSFCCAKVSGGSLLKEDGVAIPMNTVFQARLFGEKAELRWLHRSQGAGDAVLLADELIGPSPSGWNTSESANIVECVSTQYVLWGQADSRVDGWTTLWSNRIGPMPVPYRTNDDFVSKKGRLVLKAREYLQERQDGNVVVAEERLLRLAKMRKEHGDG